VNNIIRRLARQVVQSAYLARETATGGRPALIMLLSHMRGYTTLISHVLGSHPEIRGYREYGQSYLSEQDINELRWNSYRETGKSGTRYILDKILHSKYEIDDRFLADRQNRFLIAIREPVPTIQSLLRLGEYSNSVWTENSAFKAYVRRLNELVDFAQRAHRLGNPVLLVRSEEIVDDTDALFARLANFLTLTSSLSKQYDIFAKTGQGGAGDPSPAIRQGVVKKIDHQTPAEISGEIAKTASEKYHEALANIKAVAVISA
jgi:hypothetical protein